MHNPSNSYGYDTCRVDLSTWICSQEEIWNKFKQPTILAHFGLVNLAKSLYMWVKISHPKESVLKVSRSSRSERHCKWTIDAEVFDNRILSIIDSREDNTCLVNPTLIKSMYDSFKKVYSIHFSGMLSLYGLGPFRM